MIGLGWVHPTRHHLLLLARDKRNPTRPPCVPLVRPMQQIAATAVWIEALRHDCGYLVFLQCSPFVDRERALTRDAGYTGETAANASSIAA